MSRVCFMKSMAMLLPRAAEWPRSGACARRQKLAARRRKACPAQSSSQLKSAIGALDHCTQTIRTRSPCAQGTRPQYAHTQARCADTKATHHRTSSYARRLLERSGKHAVPTLRGTRADCEVRGAGRPVGSWLLRSASAVVDRFTRTPRSTCCCTPLRASRAYALGRVREDADRSSLCAAVMSLRDSRAADRGCFPVAKQLALPRSRENEDYDRGHVCQALR
ncbi:hypothetical protein OH77DRAFT_64267 [Trametes cingulata]|nr:hypothetical protein OH77DRAFT_64267 [Trametes cingulata]